MNLDTIIPHRGGLLMISRRSFIIASGMTALASTRVFGANDTLRIGVIGAGQRMKGLLSAADKAAPYQIVAVSDVYAHIVMPSKNGRTVSLPRISTIARCSTTKRSTQ